MTSSIRGPSPRVRGSPGGGQDRLARRGSIPACAGKPATTSRGRPSAGVHPRVCGEASRMLIAGSRRRGPSPRVRGSRGGIRAAGIPRGSIPACAGKPIHAASCPAISGVHPRVCGEAGMLQMAQEPGEGPSPRVRGSPAAGARGARAPGSIPACAGKPWPSRLSTSGSRVHPRVCGEAWPSATSRFRVPGPSPRVRGSPDEVGADALVARSIPACAGKPRASRRTTATLRVHPRVCGEAVRGGRWTTTRRGPSPRVRGSLIRPTTGMREAGSIPACAGKPSSGA